MSHLLRPYQADDSDAIEQALLVAQAVLYVLPTGAGKTTVANELARREIARGGAVTFLADREELVRQAHDRIGGRVIMASYRPTEGVSRPDNPGVTIASVATLARRSEAPDATLAFVDEAHLYAAASFSRVAEAYRSSGTRLVGLTATPARLDGRGLGGLFSTVVRGPSSEELIRQGWLVPVDHRAPTGEWWDSVALSGGDFDSAGLEQAAGAVLSDIPGRWADLGGADRPTLVFAATVPHAYALADEFSRHLFLRGLPPAEVIVGTTPQHIRRSVRDRIEFGQLRVVVTVGVLGTGFDAPSVSCVVMARPTLSWALFLQQCLDADTEVLTRRGWARHDDVRPADTVAGFNVATSEIEWVAIDGFVSRPLAEDERMFSIRAPHLDIRVTGGHEMLVRARGKTARNWCKEPAEVSAHRTSMWTVPVAGIMAVPPSSLTDYEIRFLGWFLTDGTISAKGRAVSISQSSAALSRCEDIRTTLRGCGFRFGECRLARKGDFAKYPDVIQFSVSIGSPRRISDRHLKGCGHLVEWLDKSIPVIYESLDDRQVSVLMDAMNEGDGTKKKVAWTRRTMEITTGDNEIMADRLQSLLVRRGFRCNKSVTRPVGRLPQFYLHVRAGKCVATIAGMGDRDGKIGAAGYTRSRFRPDVVTPGELVWCLTNRLGTLVVRRNGKVAIVGNCGRGMRPALGKLNLLLVDCAGNSLRHGFCTKPFEVSLDGLTRKHRRAVAGLTTCRKCWKVYEWTEPVCPQCGAAKPRGAERRIREVDGQLVELTGAQQWAERAGAGQQVRKLAAWIEEGKRRNWKPNAPMARFRGTFHRWPTSSEIEQARKAVGQ